MNKVFDVIIEIEKLIFALQCISAFQHTLMIKFKIKFFS